jgi:very-short-patch-repair endonuclease
MNPFERDVSNSLEKRGLRLIPQYGESGYYIDFAVMHPDFPSQPILAIEADGASYHSSRTARDRDRLRQSHLERLGWHFHRIWSTDWFQHREAEVDRAVEAYKAAISRDSPPQPGNPTVDVTGRFDGPDDGIVTLPERGKPPKRRAGGSIDKYSERDLRSAVRWVKSDGRLYTDDELLSEVMQALGFRKRGKQIVKSISEAIKAEGDS